jgi:GTPase SAR1 family protein
MKKVMYRGVTLCCRGQKKDVFFIISELQMLHDLENTITALENSVTALETHVDAIQQQVYTSNDPTYISYTVKLVFCVFTAISEKTQSIVECQHTMARAMNMTYNNGDLLVANATCEYTKIMEQFTDSIPIARILSRIDTRTQVAVAELEQTIGLVSNYLDERADKLPLEMYTKYAILMRKLISIMTADIHVLPAEHVDSIKSDARCLFANVNSIIRNSNLFATSIKTIEDTAETANIALCERIQTGEEEERERTTAIAATDALSKAVWLREIRLENMCNALIEMRSSVSSIQVRIQTALSISAKSHDLTHSLMVVAQTKAANLLHVAARNTGVIYMPFDKND